MTDNIKPIGCRYVGISSTIDYKYQQIIQRLAKYGLRPSGSKSIDKARLHEIELKEAEKENCITSKFLTVTQSEQEKIQAKKKAEKTEDKIDLYQNKMGQELLGQQIMITLDLKDKFKID